MIRSLYYKTEQHLQVDLSWEQITTFLKEPTGVLWVDFEGTPPEEDEPLLREIFHFHPLAVDDALQESHVPKIDDWGSFLYIVLHSVSFDQEQHDEINTWELDVFLGTNFMVTHHDHPIAAVERTWNACHRDERHLKSGADHLLYRLADEVVASYMPVVEEMDDEIDHIEDHLFNQPRPEILEHVFALKRAALQLRRIIGPQREVLNKLARDDYAVVDSRARVYFRDVYDHLVRLHDITESLRDLISGTLETYLSVINNRMNDIMKTLTIITTLFMPISFLAGFFGMNYFAPTVPLPAWTSLPSFIFTIVLTLAFPAGMFYWMHRRGWL
jgi:magnesium transporter